MVKDFTVKISPYTSTNDVATNIATNASSGTSYDSEWTNINVKQQMGTISSFRVKLGGIDCSSALPVNVMNVLGVYYDNALVFVGLVINVAYENYNTLVVDGFDFSVLLKNKKTLTANNVLGIQTEKAWTAPSSCITISQLLSIINSPKDKDDWSDYILPKGTIDSINLTGELKYPLMDALQAFFYTQNAFAQNIYFYVSEITGSINAALTRGTSTAVGSTCAVGGACLGGQDGYYLTGTKTNAYLGKRYYNGQNIINKITVVGHGGKVSATYSDYTTKETTLTCGDQRLIYPFSANITTGACGWNGSNGIMQLYSVSDMPATGTVLLRNGEYDGIPVLGATWFGINATIAYTGKSGNSITGCTIISASLAGGVFNWAANTPVFMKDRIYVADTSAFDDSGEILIGDEVITYTGKAATYFTIASAGTAARLRYTATTTSITSDITATSTTIPCTVNSLSGWEASGYVTLYPETIYYGSRTDTNLLDCQRDPLTATAHVVATTLVVQTFYPEPHPSGVLVKQNTDGAIDATNSSIKLNGLYEKTISEPNLVSKEDVETYACQILRNHRFGDIYHELYPQDVGGDFDLLFIGDKVKITDSTIGISAVDARVQRMELMLDREGGNYQLFILTQPYDYAFNKFEFSPSSTDYINQHKFGRWL
jgi:hypothetical protein